MPSPRPTLAALLDPAPAAVPLVVTPAHVGGRAAWSQLRGAGVLAELHDDVAVSVGTTVGPVHRALALARTLPSGCALAASTAAWVHTGLHGGAAAPAWPAGALIELAYSPGAHCPVPQPGLVARRLPGLARETTLLGNVPVTTRDRTAVDVARSAPLDVAVPVLVALAEQGTDLVRAAALLDRRARVLGRPAARRAFAAALDALTG